MDADQSKFLKKLVNQMLNSAIHSVFFRLPWPVTVGLVVVLTAIIYFFKLF
jgi:hypothetical protein